jgi:hypothetical protein
MTANLEKTSIHEAGHAVVAYRLGAKVMGVSVIPKGCVNGHCRVAIKERVTDCIHMLAGYEAQMIFDPEDTDDPSIVDYRMVWRICDREGIGGKLYRELFDQAKKAVRDNWAQIKAVADALLRFKRITGDLVRDIVKAIDNGEDYTSGWEWNWHESLERTIQQSVER